MIEIKNKKTGRTDIISEQEYEAIRNNPLTKDKFLVTTISTKTIIPSINLPDEIKSKRVKNEG